MDKTIISISQETWTFFKINPPGISHKKHMTIQRNKNTSLHTIISCEGGELESVAKCVFLSKHGQTVLEPTYHAGRRSLMCTTIHKQYIPRTQMGPHILEDLTHKMEGQPPQKRGHNRVLGSTYSWSSNFHIKSSESSWFNVFTCSQHTHLVYSTHRG